MRKNSRYIDLNKTIVRDSKGSRITDAYIKKSLKETEAYRKLLRAQKTKIIKKKITFKTITVRLPKELHKLAKLKAKKKGLSISDLTRIALEKYLKAG